MTQPRSDVRPQPTDALPPDALPPDALPPDALSVEVVAVGACFCLTVGAIGTTTIGQVGAEVSDQVLLLAWSVFAVAGGVVLDRRPGSPMGRNLAVLSAVPVVVIAVVLLRHGGTPTRVEWSHATSTLSGLGLALPWVALPWAVRAPAPARWALPLVACVLVGASAVLVGPAPPGWVLVAVGVGGLGLLSARAASADDRDRRRRLGLVHLALGAAGVGVAVGAALVETTSAQLVAGVAVALLAVSACRIELADDLRPGDEVVLDVVLVLGCVLAASVVAVLVRLGAQLVGQPAPGSLAVLSAVLTLVMAVPAASWVRRSSQVRRYGTGIIAPADVEALTADLHSRTDPRALLDKAARLVAAASGSRAASIVLGPEEPDAPSGWVTHPLSVGGDRVGTLMVDAGSPEGPEPRQQRVVAQLRPTVALMSRAVGLAVEAEHARQDVARERDAERRRILDDLHDGLGPLLAGMSMRVQATLREVTSEHHLVPAAPRADLVGDRSVDLLHDLVGDLSRARADLRRLVAGITPSALEGSDLQTALAQLAASFGAAEGGPRVTLAVDVPASVSPSVDVAVYRCVAEGLTNALRHAHASSVAVAVGWRDGCVVTTIDDDGTGGTGSTVVPGVGLTSLLGRARSLGGRLDVSPRPGGGLRLRMDLPSPVGPSEEASWSR